MRDDGLIRVRCINYEPGDGENCYCQSNGSNCIGDIFDEKGDFKIRICRESILIDWIQYIKYNHLLKPIGDI